MGQLDIYLEQSNVPIPANEEWVQVLYWNFKNGFYPRGSYWGRWEIVNGTLEGEDTFQNEIDQAVYLFPFSYGSNFIMETKVMFVKATRPRTAEVQLLSRDSEKLNYECGMALFAEGQRVDVRLMSERIDHIYETISIGRKVTYGEWYVIRFMLHNGRIMAYLDGELIYTSRHSLPLGYHLEPHLTVEEGIARFEYVRILVIKSDMSQTAPGCD